MAKKLTIKKPSSIPVAMGVITDFFEVKLVRLLTCSCELTVSGVVRPPFEVECNFTININEGAKSKVVLVNAGVDVFLKQNSETPHANCTKASVVFQVVFQAKDQFPQIKDADRKTLITSGSVVAWPYLRSHVQSTIAAMGLPPIVVPLFHPAQMVGCKIGRIGDSEVTADEKPKTSNKRPKTKRVT